MKHVTQKTLSLQLATDQAKKFHENLLNNGFTQKTDPNQYVEWRLVGDNGVAIMYTSGKLVLQGKPELFEICDQLLDSNAAQKGPAKEKKVDLSLKFDADLSEFRTLPHLGCDETGKGEYFGPLVTCACYVDPADIDFLVGSGIQDSKRIADKKIFELAEKIKTVAEYYVFMPEVEYFNQRFASLGNISIVLAEYHANSIAELMKKLSKSNVAVEHVIIDKFSKVTSRMKSALSSVSKVVLNSNASSLTDSSSKEQAVDLSSLKVHEFEKGERDIVVACASILAREQYLAVVSGIEAKYELKLPRGYNGISEFKASFVAEYGIEEWGRIAKVGFGMGKDK